MKIGIPKALLYFKYAHLWEGFFKALGVEYIISPDTNKEIISRGMSLAVDESCLSFKVYLGHVDWLMGRCDSILVPRISNFGRAGTVCTRFQAIYDVVKNTFRENKQPLLHYNVDLNTSEKQMGAFLKMGEALGKKKPNSLFAYLAAKQEEKNANSAAAEEQVRLLKENKIKILVIAHCYNSYDRYIGEPVLKALRLLGAVPILGSAVNTREAAHESLQLSETVPWLFSKELLGSIAIYQNQIDGIILMSTFPCGPDSLVNEIIIRRVTDKPILSLILDGQEGTAGLQTRLESFVDIINFKRDDLVG